VETYESFFSNLIFFVICETVSRKWCIKKMVAICVTHFVPNNIKIEHAKFIVINLIN